MLKKIIYLFFRYTNYSITIIFIGNNVIAASNTLPTNILSDHTGIIELLEKKQNLIKTSNDRRNDRVSHLENINNKIRSINHAIEQRKEELEDIEHEDSELRKLNNNKKLYEQLQQSIISSDESSTESLEQELKEVNDMISTCSNFDEGHIVTSTPKKSQSSRSDNLDALTSSLDLSSDNGINIFNDCNLELDALSSGGNQTNHNTPNSSYNNNQNLAPSDRNNDIEALNLKDELDAVDGSGGNQTNHNTPNSSYNNNQNLAPSDRNNDIEALNLKDELDAVDGSGGNQTNHNTPNSSYNNNQNLAPSDRNNDIEALNLKDELDAVDGSGGNQTNHNTPNSSYNNNQNLAPSDRNNDIEALNLKDELDAVDGSGGNQTNHNTPNSSYNNNQNLAPSDRNNDIEALNLKDELDAVDGSGGNQTNHNTPNSSYNNNQNLAPSDRNNDIEALNLKDELDAVDGSGGNQTNHNTPNSSYNNNQNLAPSDRNNDIEALNLKDELDAVDGSGGNQTNHNTPNSSYNNNQNLAPSDRNNDIEALNLKDELDAVDGSGGNQTNHNTPNSSYNNNQNLAPSDRNNDIEALNLKDELDAVDGSGGNQTNHNTPNSSYNNNQNLAPSDRNNDIEALNLKDELDAVDGSGGNQTNHNTPNSSYNNNQNLAPSDRNNDIEALNLKDELDAVDGSGGNQTNHNTPNSSYNNNQNLAPSDRNNDIEALNLKDELKEPSSRILDRISQFRASNNEVMLALKMFYQIIQNRLIGLNGKSQPISGGDEQNRGFSIWDNSGYAISKQDSGSSISSYTGRMLAIILGGEISFNDSYILGIAYGNIHSYLRFNETLGKSRINSHMVSAYYQKDLDRNVSLQLIGSLSGSNIKNVINAQRHDKSYIRGMGIEGNLSYYHNFTSGMQLVPNISLKYYNMLNNLYKEQRAYDYLLKISRKSRKVFNCTIGSKIILNSTDINSHLKLIPSLQGSIERKFFASHKAITATFTSNQDIPKEIQKVDMTRNSRLGYNIGAGIIAQNNNIKLQFDYNYYMYKKYSTHSGTITVRFDL